MDNKVLVVYRVNREDPSNLGVIQKMIGFIQGLESNNYTVDHIVSGRRDIFFNSRSIRSFHRLFPNELIQWTWFKYLENIDFSQYEVIFVRYGLSTPSFIRWLDLIRTRWPRIRIVIDMPTYPYEQEWRSRALGRLLMAFERQKTKLLKDYVDYVLHSGDENDIFGIPTIKMGNGITPYNKTPKRSWNPPEIRLIAVGKWNYWHGLDRIVLGLSKYVSRGGKDVYLDIIGEGPERDSIYRQIKRNGLEDFITLHTSMPSNELEQYFSRATIGVGTLGLFRKGVSIDSSLKHRQYVKQGLPFIYAGMDGDIERNESFVLNVPSDNAPIDISNIVSFVEKYDYHNGANRMDELLRTKLSWKVKVKQICLQIGIRIETD